MKKFTVLKTFVGERDYYPNEIISLNNKKQIEFLLTNKYIK